VNRRLKTEVNGVSAPDPNEEYFIYQVLVGTWPFDETATGEFGVRLKNYLTKALREAKVHTSWLTPDVEYERAVLSFVDGLLSERRPFLERFRPFQRRVAEIGMVNSLAQLLIKCTAPGVPDFYQGTELWDLTFVDPDNRRPVDYGVRTSLLQQVQTETPSPSHARTLVETRQNGRIKLYTIARALAVRRALAGTFASGAYVPLRTTGTHAEQIFAFARTGPSGIAVTCVPRLIGSLPGRCASPPLGRECWGDTAALLPCSLGALPLANAFTGQQVTPTPNPGNGTRLEVGDVFADFPVGLLTASRPSAS